MGAEQEQHDEREQSHEHGHGQQHAVGAQPQLPGRCVAETRPEVMGGRRRRSNQTRLCSSRWRWRSVAVSYSPGDVQPPQQHQQLDSQVKDKPAVVPLTDAVLDPGTVMVVTPDAVLTRLAVL